MAFMTCYYARFVFRHNIKEAHKKNCEWLDLSEALTRSDVHFTGKSKNKHASYKPLFKLVKAFSK